MNKVILIGVLFKDPELKKTTTNKNLVNFGLLVNDLRNSKQSFIFNCTA
jgi:single-stranded DNA-binding protein